MIIIIKRLIQICCVAALALSGRCASAHTPTVVEVAPNGGYFPVGSISVGHSGTLTAGAGTARFRLYVRSFRTADNGIDCSILDDTVIMSTGTQSYEQYISYYAQDNAAEHQVYAEAHSRDYPNGTEWKNGDNLSGQAYYVSTSWFLDSKRNEWLARSTLRLESTRQDIATTPHQSTLARRCRFSNLT